MRLGKPPDLLAPYKVIVGYGLWDLQLFAPQVYGADFAALIPLEVRAEAISSE